MKMCKIMFQTIAFVLMSMQMQAQIGKVGINTTTPQAMLHVKDSSVLFSGGSTTTLPTTPGKPPASGAGTRMMWYPDKAAFRVGTVGATEWDKDSIGNFSFASGGGSKAKGDFSTAMGFFSTAPGYASTAIGSNTTASNQYSTAMGYSTTASGYTSTAMGFESTASGFASTAIGSGTRALNDYSTAMGYLTTASGSVSTAMGYNTSASGSRSTAMGANTIASYDYCTAMGFNTNASGEGSTAMGYNTNALAAGSTALGFTTRASGQISTSMGNYTTARAYASLAIGQFNDSIATSSPLSSVATDPVFIIGNGTADNARSNALTILKNAKTGINTPAPKAMLHVVKNGPSGGTFLNNASVIVEDNTSSFIQLSNPATAENGILSSSVISPIRSGMVFSVDSSISFRAGGNVERMRLAKNGNLQIDGVLTQSSDMYLKTNITLLRNSLPLLLKVNGYTYHWKNETSDAQLQTGVLAQEVEKVLPQLVYTAADGTKSVNYNGLVPHLLQALKEQQVQIDEILKELKEWRRTKSKE